MTRPIGKAQLAVLMRMGTRAAVVVPDRVTRSLVKRGLCTAEPNGSFTRITADGLRALADGIDAGRVALPSFDSVKRTDAQTSDGK